MNDDLATAEDIEPILETPLGRLALKEFTAPTSPREVRVFDDGEVILRLKREHISGSTAPGPPVEIYLHNLSGNNEAKIRTFIERLKELRKLRGLVNLENPSPDLTNIGNYMAVFRQVAFLMRELSES